MRNLRSSGLLLVIILVLIAPRGPAQTFTLPAVSFTGAPTFSQTDLLSVTGLHTGVPTNQAAVQAAAQHLSDTGLFAEVGFASDPQGGIIFTLKPMPAENLLQVRFANFVFWSPQELDTLLKARLPLYNGSIPISGTMQDRLSAMLKILLTEKSVPQATISSTPTSIAPGSAATLLTYRIDSPPIRVHSIAVLQASTAMQPRLALFIQSNLGKPYEESFTREILSDQLTTLYRDQGFLDMTLLSLTHPAPQAAADAINVDLKANVQEGAAYHIFAFSFEGAPTFSAADFAKAARLKAGDLASPSALRASLATIAGAYRAKGFEDVEVTAPATFNRTTHTVAYAVAVTPGERYRLGSVKTIGLNEAQQKDFDAAWALRPGDFYDPAYLGTFLKTNPIRSLNGYSASYTASPDRKTHTIDLALTFARTAAAAS